MYNIIDGIVVIKFSFFVKEGYKLQSFFRSIMKYGTVCCGGGEEAGGDSKEMSFTAVLACVII